MNPIKSRLLKRLDAEIAAAPSQLRGASLKAQRAILIARHGQISQAREQLTALHQLAFQHPHPEIGAWLHLAEGLMSYFTDFSSSARGKIQRAQAIAKAAGLLEVEVLAAAWSAHQAYTYHDLTALTQHARTCLDLSTPEHHAARGRLAMTLGVAYQFANRQESAQAWYATARRHAMAEGDDATQSALIYNMAEMRTAQVRHQALAHPGEPLPELLLGADSVMHYDAAVGGSAKAELTPVLRAQVLTLQGEFAAALKLYERHLPQAMSMGLARLGSSLLADLAWCRVNLGQREHALQQAREAEIELDPGCDVDDRAATHSRLAQVWTALGETECAARHADSAKAEWAEFARQQQAWGQALDEAGLARPA